MESGISKALERLQHFGAPTSPSPGTGDIPHFPSSQETSFSQGLGAPVPSQNQQSSRANSQSRYSPPPSLLFSSESQPADPLEPEQPRPRPASQPEISRPPITIELNKPDGTKEAWIANGPDRDRDFWRIARYFFGNAGTVSEPQEGVSHPEEIGERLSVYLVYFERGSRDQPHWIIGEEDQPLDISPTLFDDLIRRHRDGRWYIIKRRLQVRLTDATHPQQDRSITVDTSQADHVTLYKNMVAGVRRLFPRKPSEKPNDPSAFGFTGASQFDQEAPISIGKFVIPMEDPFAFARNTWWLMEENVIYVWPHGYTPCLPLAEAKQQPIVPLASYPAHWDGPTQNERHAHDQVLNRILQDRNYALMEELTQMKANEAQYPNQDSVHQGVNQSTPSLAEQVQTLEVENATMRAVLETARRCFSGTCGTGHIGVPRRLTDTVDLAYLFWDHWYTWHVNAPEGGYLDGLEPNICEVEDCHAKLDAMSQIQVEQHEYMHSLINESILERNEGQTFQGIKQETTPVPALQPEVILTHGTLDTEEIEDDSVFDESTELYAQQLEEQWGQQEERQGQETGRRVNRGVRGSSKAKDAGEAAYRPAADESEEEGELRDPGKLPKSLEELAEDMISKARASDGGFDDSKNAIKPFFAAHNLKVCNVCLQFCQSYDTARSHYADCKTAPWNFVTAKVKNSVKPLDVKFAKRHAVVPSSTGMQKQRKRRRTDDSSSDPTGSGKKRQKASGGGDTARSMRASAAPSIAKSTGSARGSSGRGRGRGRGKGGKGRGQS